MGRISLLVIAAALLSLPATANEDAKELERLLAKVRSEPMIFVVATGEPNACGRGCTEWIGAEVDDGAAQRFQEFITHLENRNRPIFFNSDGGLVGEAVKIGLILRENRMTAGVARSVPEGCNLGSPPTEACRRLMGSKPAHQGRLYFGGARCASACVYAMVGASTRHVDPAATVRIHSGVGPDLDKTDNALRRYVVTMGVDATLVDAATKIPSRSFRGLSRGEMEQFGLETRGVHETPWFAYHGPTGEFVLLKSVTLATGDAGDEFRTRTVGLACDPLHPRIKFMYRQELTLNESRSPPILRAKLGDNLIEFTSSFTPNKNAIEKGFDVEPRQLHSAIEKGGFEIIQTPDQLMTKKTPVVVKFSTSELSTEIAALESRCGSTR